jgi:hypothetical protein
MDPRTGSFFFCEVNEVDAYRHEAVVVSLTPEEKQALRVAAALAGTSMSSYVRRVLSSTGCLKTLEESQLMRVCPGSSQVESSEESHAPNKSQNPRGPETDLDADGKKPTDWT